MRQSGAGAEDKSPEKEPPKKKERSGGSIKKRLSIGYGFSTLRKRNPIKGVFEEDERKKGKSIEIKVDDLGWKQTKHVGQEEAQQLKALMVLTKQLGEEDTDEIAQLLEEWDAGKVQKEIEDKKRIQMQKNRSLQVVMEQWGRGTVRDEPPGPVDSDSAVPSIMSTSSSSSSSTTSSSTHTALLRTGTDSAGFASIVTTSPSPGTSATLSPVTSATLSPVASSDRVAAVLNNNDATADRDQIMDEPKATLDASMTSASNQAKLCDYDRGRRRSSFDDSSTWSMDDEYTADSSVIIEDDDEDLMEVPEIGSEGNESEGSEGGGRSPRSSLAPGKKKKLREPRHVCSE